MEISKCWGFFTWRRSHAPTCTHVLWILNCELVRMTSVITDISQTFRHNIYVQYFWRTTSNLLYAWIKRKLHLKSLEWACSRILIVRFGKLGDLIWKMLYLYLSAFYANIYGEYLSCIECRRCPCCCAQDGRRQANTHSQIRNGKTANASSRMFT